ncbi:diacylglycerol kinase family protein [Streptomyces resistomycificus]|uniref:Diacylglycerol kinase n=1 Tax=Streptomyces resistomycificus TaxID=67356 RepID=A0A0L8KXN1_9ACTN|nr:diacylglycerol kinase family protein [Streptomyces resistomycificus]KOG30698.1 diacylglycerol kinase [Streptomyces resistomycificus]KUN98096.1 diacylglycerol kinase [Streptomyces resistomycificus]
MTEVATSAASDQLLVIIDPVARRTDGESVRIVKDVLSAGATTKVCLPDGPEEFARALQRRGSRRPVLVGDDRALVRAVSLLHRRRELAGCALSVVPVGGVLSLARSLGVPMGAVQAARAVLDGAERRMDLLVDESDGVVLGTLVISPPGRTPESEAESGTGAAPQGALSPWMRSLARTLVTVRPTRSPASTSAPGPSRLRVEVDGVILVDLDQPLESLSVAPGLSGLAEVEIRPLSVGAEATPLLATGRRVTVSGADFRYRADTVLSGPVRKRTWTVWEGAWGLVMPEVG